MLDWEETFHISSDSESDVKALSSSTATSFTLANSSTFTLGTTGGSFSRLLLQTSPERAAERGDPTGDGDVVAQRRSRRRSTGTIRSQVDDAQATDSVVEEVPPAEEPRVPSCPPSAPTQSSVPDLGVEEPAAPPPAEPSSLTTPDRASNNSSHASPLWRRERPSFRLRVPSISIRDPVEEERAALPSEGLQQANKGALADAVQRRDAPPSPTAPHRDDRNGVQHGEPQGVVAADEDGGTAWHWGVSGEIAEAEHESGVGASTGSLSRKRTVVVMQEKLDAVPTNVAAPRLIRIPSSQSLLAGSVEFANHSDTMPTAPSRGMCGTSDFLMDVLASAPGVAVSPSPQPRDMAAAGSSTTSHEGGGGILTQPSLRTSPMFQQMIGELTPTSADTYYVFEYAGGFAGLRVGNVAVAARRGQPENDSLAVSESESFVLTKGGEGRGKATVTFAVPVDRISSSPCGRRDDAVAVVRCVSATSDVDNDNDRSPPNADAPGTGPARTETVSCEDPADDLALVLVAHRSAVEEALFAEHDEFLDRIWVSEKESALYQLLTKHQTAVRQWLACVCSDLVAAFAVRKEELLHATLPGAIEEVLLGDAESSERSSLDASRRREATELESAFRHSFLAIRTLELERSEMERRRDCMERCNGDHAYALADGTLAFHNALANQFLALHLTFAAALNSYRCVVGDEARQWGAILSSALAVREMDVVVQERVLRQRLAYASECLLVRLRQSCSLERQRLLELERLQFQMDVGCVRIAIEGVEVGQRAALWLSCVNVVERGARMSLVVQQGKQWQTLCCESAQLTARAICEGEYVATMQSLWVRHVVARVVVPGESSRRHRLQAEALRELQWECQSVKHKVELTREEEVARRNLALLCWKSFLTLIFEPANRIFVELEYHRACALLERAYPEVLAYLRVIVPQWVRLCGGNAGATVSTSSSLPQGFRHSRDLVVIRRSGGAVIRKLVEVGTVFSDAWCHRSAQAKEQDRNRRWALWHRTQARCVSVQASSSTFCCASEQELHRQLSFLVSLREYKRRLVIETLKGNPLIRPLSKYQHDLLVDRQNVRVATSRFPRVQPLVKDIVRRSALALTRRRFALDPQPYLVLSSIGHHGPPPSCNGVRQALNTCRPPVSVHRQQSETPLGARYRSQAVRFLRSATASIRRRLACRRGLSRLQQLYRARQSCGCEIDCSPCRGSVERSLWISDDCAERIAGGARLQDQSPTVVDAVCPLVDPAAPVVQRAVIQDRVSLSLRKPILCIQMFARSKRSVDVLCSRSGNRSVAKYVRAIRALVGTYDTLESYGEELERRIHAEEQGSCWAGNRSAGRRANSLCAGTPSSGALCDGRPRLASERAADVDSIYSHSIYYRKDEFVRPDVRRPFSAGVVRRSASQQRLVAATGPRVSATSASSQRSAEVFRDAADFAVQDWVDHVEERMKRAALRPQSQRLTKAKVNAGR